MQTVTTIGLDIAKSVFQVHGVDAAGQVVIHRKLKRRYVLAFFQKLPPCLVGIEACASSHYWGRELQALDHTVRLMPPAYVKPYALLGLGDLFPIFLQRAAVALLNRLPPFGVGALPSLARSQTVFSREGGGSEILTGARQETAGRPSYAKIEQNIRVRESWEENRKNH
jgi:hypothetical protein